MRGAERLFLLSSLFVSGCGTQSTAVAPYEVTVLGPTTGVATGASALVQIGIHGTRHEDWGGWGDGPQVPTLSVDHVSCSPGCVVTDGGGGYAVTATTAGRRVVELAFSTSDGKQSVRSVTIDFRDATRIDARRGGTSPSGSAFAMVPGDGQWWTVSVADEHGPLLVALCQPEVIATGAVTVDVARCNGTVGVDAVTPGAGTVTMRYGSIVRSEPITVIDPADIQLAELREVLLSSDGGIDVASADGVLAPARVPIVFTDCRTVGERLLVPQLTTADGTIAYGAANLLGVIPSSVRVELYAQVVGLSFVDRAPGTLRGNFGSSARTTLSVPFVFQADPTCGP